MPTMDDCNDFFIFSKVELEVNFVSASRKIKMFPFAALAPKFLAFETFLSLIKMTLAYFLAFDSVASVQPLQTTIFSASFGKDNKEDSMYFSS